MCLGAHEKIIMNWKERAEAERRPPRSQPLWVFNVLGRILK